MTIANGPLKYVLQVVDYKIRLYSIMALFFKKVSFIIKGSNSLHVQTWFLMAMECKCSLFDTFFILTEVDGN